MSQNVNINLVPGNYPKEFHVSQYDVGRQLVANIVDSTGAYSIPSGATVTLVGTKPSGFGFTLSGSVGSGGVVTFSTTATVTAEYGRIPCELRITSGSTILGTANCMLIVEESPHPEGTTDGDGEVIVNQITLLLEQITQQADRADDAKEDAEAAANEAKTSELAAEGYAVGKQNGTDVGPESPYYRNNCKWYGAQFDEALKDYAKINGYYKDMTVGTAKQLLSDSTTTDTEPYIYRQTAGDGDREEVEVVGGTVAWNQLCNSASVTVPNGHKYYMIKGGTASIGASTGTAITGLTGGTDIVTDLTAMFGTAIADAIYAMEQATAGAGVAFFRKLFPKDYYEYNAGELISVKTSSHNTVGFNALDPNNLYQFSNDSVRTTNHIPVIGGQTYELCCDSLEMGTGTRAAYMVEIDADGNETDNASYASTFTSLIVTMKSSTVAVRLDFYTNTGIPLSRVLDSNPCLHLVWDGERNGEYEPYVKHSYPLDSSLELRGIPKLDASNKLYYDGDTYESDGTVTRKYSVVDLGTLNWTYDGTSCAYGFFTSSALSTRKAGSLANAICSKYVVNIGGRYSLGGGTGQVASFNETNANAVCVRDDSYTDATEFKSAMSGIYLVYEKATPTTETADPYTAIQVCDPNGTEEWTDERTVQIPVGNVTKYHANLKEKLEEMPAIPTAPSANGTYTLKATVSGGAVTYQWVNG